MTKAEQLAEQLRIMRHDLQARVKELEGALREMVSQFGFVENYTVGEEYAVEAARKLIGETK